VNLTLDTLLKLLKVLNLVNPDFKTKLQEEQELLFQQMKQSITVLKITQVLHS
jgi:hypothetical protein